MPERAEAKTKKDGKILTERPNVFTITGKYSYKTSQAIYHNAGNIILKLASFGFVSEKKKITHFPKRIRSVFAESVAESLSWC
jgi:hypothetical protein